MSLYPVTIPLQYVGAVYYVQATIGQQIQAVLFDTGSSNAVVSAIGCITPPYNDACAIYFNSTLYNPHVSSTSINTDVYGTAEYTGGTVANGTIYNDTFSLTSTAYTPDINFIAATSTSMYSTGILGANNNMGDTEGNSTDTVQLNNWFDTWYSLNKPYGALNTMSIDLCITEPYIELSPGMNSHTNNDTVYITNNIQYGPAVNLQSMTIDNTIITTNNTTYAILDTGTSAMYVPSHILQQITTILLNNSKFQSVFPTANSTFFYNTNNPQAAIQGPALNTIYTTLPNITANIITGTSTITTLTIQPAAYITLGYLITTTNQYYYSFGIGTMPQLDTSNEIILGVPVLQQYYITLNRTSNDIYFTPQPTTCYIIPTITAANVGQAMKYNADTNMTKSIVIGIGVGVGCLLLLFAVVYWYLAKKSHNPYTWRDIRLMCCTPLYGARRSTLIPADGAILAFT